MKPARARARTLAVVAATVVVAAAVVVVNNNQVGPVASSDVW